MVNHKHHIEINGSDNFSHGGSALAHALLSASGVQDTKELILLPEPDNNQEKRINVYPSNGQQTSLKIYPVPATNELFIESNVEIEGNIVIFDNLNRPLKQINSNKSKSFKIDISDLVYGSYYLRIGNNFYKFIKAK